jgi:rubredoxin|tara:strand:+ start:1442 stop:1708 length:267 start_codon:yes stop_codon:yes gene_type:complete
MFILKFFASLFLLFIGIVILFFVFSFLIARKAVSDLNDSLAEKFNEDSTTNSGSNFTDIPEAIECKSCGTYYAKLPDDKKCSCGAKLI